MVEGLASEQVALDLHRLAGQRQQPELAGEALAELLDPRILAPREDRAEGRQRLRRHLLAIGNLFERSAELHHQPSRLLVVGIRGQQGGGLFDECTRPIKLFLGEHLLGFGNDLEPLGLHRQSRHGAGHERRRKLSHRLDRRLVSELAQPHQAGELELRRFLIERIVDLDLRQDRVGRLHRHPAHVADVGDHLFPRRGLGLGRKQTLHERQQLFGGALGEGRHGERRRLSLDSRRSAGLPRLDDGNQHRHRGDARDQRRNKHERQAGQNTVRHETLG